MHYGQLELNKKRIKEKLGGKKGQDGPRTRPPHTKAQSPSMEPR